MPIERLALLGAVIGIAIAWIGLKIFFVAAPALRRKTHVVYQSARVVRNGPPLKSCFQIVVSGHLRGEKDPFRTAAALCRLPAASRIRVFHMGIAMNDEMAREAAGQT